MARRFLVSLRWESQTQNPFVFSLFFLHLSTFFQAFFSPFVLARLSLFICSFLFFVDFVFSLSLLFSLFFLWALSLAFNTITRDFWQLKKACSLVSHVSPECPMPASASNHVWEWPELCSVAKERYQNAHSPRKVLQAKSPRPSCPGLRGQCCSGGTKVT